jgi:membrane-associated protein
MVVLCVAAILGDAVNYSIGRRIGPKVFNREDSILLNKKHLERTRHFYAKHGGKTIVLARFIPIIRTFAPFVAGIGKMEYPRFALYNVTGAIAWVVGVTLLGYFFGNLPIVKENFAIVLVAIVVISCLPLGIEILRAWRARGKEEHPRGGTEARRGEEGERGRGSGVGAGAGGGAGTGTGTGTRDEP